MVATRVGLFGGTFDPPHVGHVRAIEAARDALGLDLVVVEVANEPAGKPDVVASGARRLAMARGAFGDLERVEVRDDELVRGGPTYTIETVEQLAGLLGPRPFLILGADAAVGLDRWHRAGELAALVRIAVVPRPGAPTRIAQGFEGEEVPMAPVDLSSSQVRAALASGAAPEGLVAPGAIPEMGNHRLYAR